jgi:hypothetical protein
MKMANNMPGVAPVEKNEALEQAVQRMDAIDRLLRSLFTSVLPVAINFGVVITLIGFVVINFRLATITNYFTYNISLTQYVAAGLIFLVQQTAIMIPGIILGTLAAVAASQIAKRSAWLRKVLRWLIPLMLPTYVCAILLVAASFIFGTASFGRGTYSAIPRSIGGGAPADIRIIFRESSKDLDWGILIDSKTGRSEMVELVLELSDGILIRGKTTQIVAKISNDAIYGVIADSIAPTPAATNPASVTPTPIAGPTTTP